VPIVEKQPTNIAEQLEKLKGYSLENRPGTKEYQLKCCKNKAINIVHNIQQIDSKYTLEESKQLDLTTLNKILKQIATYGEDLMKIILELDTIYTDDSEFKQSKKEIIMEIQKYQQIADTKVNQLKEIINETNTDNNLPQNLPQET